MIKELKIPEDLYNELVALKETKGAESITDVIRLSIRSEQPGYMKKMSDYEMVEILATTDLYHAVNIPSTVAIELFKAFEDSPLWVDNPVYKQLEEADGLVGAEFVLREGFVCFRDRRYPTADRKFMRIDPSVTRFLVEKGVL